MVGIPILLGEKLAAVYEVARWAGESNHTGNRHVHRARSRWPGWPLGRTTLSGFWHQIPLSPVKMLKTWYVVHFLVPTRHTCASQVSWISGFLASDSSDGDRGTDSDEGGSVGTHPCHAQSVYCERAAGEREHTEEHTRTMVGQHIHEANPGLASGARVNGARVNGARVNDRLILRGAREVVRRMPRQRLAHTPGHRSAYSRAHTTYSLTLDRA